LRADRQSPSRHARIRKEPDITSSSRDIDLNLNHPARQWDRDLADSGGHLLQSWSWGEFKHLHGWNPVRIAVSDGEHRAMAQVLYRFQGPVSIGYIPRGPAISGDPARVWPLLMTQLSGSAREHRAITTLIEPDRPLGLTGRFRDAGVVLGPTHFQPGRTVKLPLGDDEAMLKQMHQKTRYSVRLAQRRGVTVERPDVNDVSLKTFYDLMQDTADRNEFAIHSFDYYRDFLVEFGDRAVMLFAHVECGSVAAVLIAARFGREAVYMYGASSTEHRSNGAAFLLQFEAMRWARDHGCDTYDLWGIPEQDPEKPVEGSVTGTRGEDWRGLYRFKTGFGGEIVTYPPMLERRHVPVLPWLARRVGAVRG
jgi:lipid II:glycine glycyltransferase (peptidoglycan interpeptide bridge formation enzyme)